MDICILQNSYVICNQVWSNTGIDAVWQPCIIIYWILLLPPLIKLPILQWESDGMKGMPSLEGDNLLVFHILSASEIWPDKGWCNLLKVNVNVLL